MSMTVVAMTLAACGNDPNRTDLGGLREALPGRAAPAAPPPNPASMARSALEQIPGPVMLAVLEDRGALAMMVPYGVNGRVTTWTTIDRQSVSLKAGRVVATRGLGFDRMSITAPAPGGSGPFTMTSRTLNAANETVVDALSCQREKSAGQVITLASGEVLATTLHTEICETAGALVRNMFWVAASGQVRQSHQWIGHEAGSLTLQVLRP